MTDETHYDFESWFQPSLSLALSYQQCEVMVSCKSIYVDYYDSEMTPEQAVEEEWG